MGPRVLGLLWDLTMAPGALPEVADGRQLVDALMAYARAGGAGIQLVWDYLGKCIAQARICNHQVWRGPLLSAVLCRLQ